MELAIPVVLLGGMYVLSNQNKDDKKASSNIKENFVANRTLPESRQRQLPNTNTPVKNYPVSGTSELIKNVAYYANPNTATDKYYQQSVYEAKAENNKNTYKSLTGEDATASDFNHNNMVPFFGSSVKQNLRNLNNNETRLDNLIGSGSQFIHKREIAPMFKPQANMQWTHGTPNTSDFIQSRINPSMSMKNVKPFQEIRVGPGLNEKGGVLGSGGFNAGMESRERWISKTVDELRTVNNPKVTYGGVILGGKREVQNRGMMGNMEKNRPDTYYVNSPERYFTTTGLEKAQTARGIELLKPENRETTTREYFGSGGDGPVEGPYVPGEYRMTMRPQLDPDVKHVSNAHARDAYKSTDGDYGIKGYKESVLPNNRTLTGGNQQFGVVSSFAKAIIAPLMDVLRPSRKENVVGNLRPTGNARSGSITAGVVYNPNDKARTTIREMTENRPDHMFVNNQQEAGGFGYTVNDQQSYGQERDTTNRSYTGIGGNTALTSNAPTYNAAYNAHLINKEPISRGRAPTTCNTSLFNGQRNTNIHIDKNDCDRKNNRMWVPQQVTKASPTKEQYGYGSTRTQYGQGVNCTRNNPAILDAFRKNPYTKSLQSWA